MTTFDPDAIITSAIGTLGSTLSGVAGPALALGAGVLALGFGWNLVKRFVN